MVGSILLKFFVVHEFLKYFFISAHPFNKKFFDQFVKNQAEIVYDYFG